MTLRRPIALLLALTLAAGMLAGCSGDTSTPVTQDDAAAELAPLRIGTLPTEDALPLWVAEQQGLFAKAGIPSVEIVTFQAAQERDAAFTAGEIDAYMGDIIAAAQMENAGVEVTIGTIMLGATPAEGRFGIVAAPDSGYNDLTALANVPVGTSSGTIQEYVLDGLMREAGVPDDQVKKEEVKKVPVRFDLLMNGKIKAAALPEPLLTLAVAQGAKLLADDATGENLSQTVLVFSDDYLTSPGGIETMAALLDVWDQAVDVVNADPNAWRATLVEKANLPEPLKDTYKVNTYPKHDVPSQEQIEAVVDWMVAKGLVEKPPTYEQLVLVTP